MCANKLISKNLLYGIYKIRTKIISKDLLKIKKFSSHKLEQIPVYKHRRDGILHIPTVCSFY